MQASREDRGLKTGGPVDLSCSNCRDKNIRLRLKLSIAVLLGVFTATLAYGQDVQTNVTYLCNGERIVIDSCNIRDTSDTSRCMVGAS